MARLFQFYTVVYDEKEYKLNGIVAAENYQDAMRKIVEYCGEDDIVSVELFELEELTFLEDLRPHAQSGN